MEKNQDNQRLYQQYLNECQEYKGKLEEKLGETRQALQSAQEQTNQWNLKCIEVEKQQEFVLSGVIQYFPRFGYLDSLYSKQETLTQMVLDKVALLEREKEEAILKERVATRWS
ncbi:hypothetical protein MOQ26_21915, partial [Stenotrophomonas maltophilia]|nr:hypothetical protein [Stenotrophomonas maltophilia]